MCLEICIFYVSLHFFSCYYTTFQTSIPTLFSIYFIRSFVLLNFCAQMRLCTSSKLTSVYLSQYLQVTVRLTCLQIEKLFDIACCLADVVAVTSFSPDAFALGPRDYVSRFLTLISTLRGGQSRYLPLLLAKLSEVLPNLPLPRSLNLPQTLPASTIGMSGTGTVPSNMAEDFSAMPSAGSPTYPSYPSSELIRRLAAQTGAQLPFNNTTPQSLIQASTSHVEDLSLYDTAHSTARSSGSAPRSSSTTPGPYEPTMSQRSSQVLTHGSVQLPSSHPQHAHMQSHHIGIAPTAYDPRFSMQGYPVDPSMMFKQ
jgi:hypothetical protein